MGEFFGIVSYEFVMQVRRRALWLAIGLLGLLIIVANNANYHPQDANLAYTRYDIVINRADAAAVLFALGAGLLLADRLRRDRRTHADELLRTTGISMPTRIGGKYVGTVAATLVPVALAYFISVCFLIAHYGDASVIPTALGLASSAALLGVGLVTLLAACWYEAWRARSE